MKGSYALCRYNHLFDVFVKAGIKVRSFDQRGFGRTGRKLNNGSLGHHEGAETLYGDIQDISNSVKIDGVPHFVMGHSMGLRC